MVVVALFAFGLFIWGAYGGGPELATEAAFPVSGLVFVLIWINEQRQPSEAQPPPPTGEPLS